MIIYQVLFAAMSWQTRILRNKLAFSIGIGGILEQQNFNSHMFNMVPLER
jgi:hypothetical protein